MIDWLANCSHPINLQNCNNAHPLVSPAFPGLTWSPLASLGFPWPFLASPGFSSPHIVLASPGLSWPPMVSLASPGLPWPLLVYLASLGPPGLTWTSPSGLHWYHMLSSLQVQDLHCRCRCRFFSSRHSFLLFPQVVTFPLLSSPRFYSLNPW